MEIHNYIIKTIYNQQLFYKLICSVEFVKSKTLTTCIKIYLANNFIKSSKSFIGALIFFIKKFKEYF